VARRKCCASEPIFNRLAYCGAARVGVEALPFESGQAPPDLVNGRVCKRRSETLKVLSKNKLGSLSSRIPQREILPCYFRLFYCSFCLVPVAAKFNRAGPISHMQWFLVLRVDARVYRRRPGALASRALSLSGEGLPTGSPSRNTVGVESTPNSFPSAISCSTCPEVNAWLTHRSNSF
jgi:hypothetical protein